MNSRMRRPGPARVPSQALDQHPKNLPCSMPSPKKSAGTSRRRRASIAASPVHGLWQLRRGGGGNLRDRRHQDQGASDRCRHRPGLRVNPAQIERQIAGSFVYGLTGLFYGGCTVKDGRIEQTNFDTYNSMRIAEMAEGGIDRDAERRLLGRRRRADHLRRGTGGAERLLRGDRQAHPLGAAGANRTLPSPDVSSGGLWGRRSIFGKIAHGRAAADDAKKRRSWHRGVSRIADAFGCPAFAQSAARVVVIGGGFGGASCARALKRIDPKLEVTLIEPNRTFIACPLQQRGDRGLAGHRKRSDSAMTGSAPKA